MYGFQPNKHNVKPKNYSGGGLVQGPGTGTSDDVPATVPNGGYVLPSDSTQALGFKPGMRQRNARGDGAALGFKPRKREAMLSDGELVLTPEQVEAAGGVEGLERFRVATHTPVPEQPQEKKFFFVNGGPLDDEKRKPFMPTLQPEVQQGMTKMYSASMPPRTQPAPAAVQPPAASGFVSSMERNQRALDASTASGPATPAAKPVNPTEVEGWRTKAVMDGAAEDAQAAWDRDQVGQAAGAVARGAITAVPTAIGEFAYNTVAPVAGAAKGFWNGLTGGSDAEPSPVTPAQAAPAVPPAAKVPPVTATTPAAVTPSGQPEKPGTPAAQANAQAPGNVNVRRQPNGVMEFSGENVSGDVSYGGSAGFKPRGAVSAQNMAAADNLAQQSAARGFTPRAQEPQPQAPQAFIPQDTGGYGLLDKNRIALRNAMIDANQGDAGGKTMVKSLLQQQAAAPGQQIERDRLAADVAAGTENRALKAEDMRSDRGFRAGQLANDSARTALEGQKVASDIEARGFEVNYARRIQKLQDEYITAKTPEEQKAAADKINALSGKSQPADDYMSISGGEALDKMGTPYKNPDLIVNRRTGEVVDGGAAKRTERMLNDIAILKRNPSLADKFDSFYGKGAAAKVLSKS